MFICGRPIAAKITAIAITIIISTKVNPCFVDRNVRANACAFDEDNSISFRIVASPINELKCST
ncbi:protein of unknown function [Thauera humireducens]|nr:protein of unknown function [Thauera humireducens]